MKLNWEEFVTAVVEASDAERGGQVAAAIANRDELIAFLKEYQHTGKTVRELVDDDRFPLAEAYLVRVWQLRRGNDPHATEIQRVAGMIGHATLSPLDAMLLHQIDWF